MYDDRNAFSIREIYLKDEGLELAPHVCSIHSDALHSWIITKIVAAEGSHSDLVIWQVISRFHHGLR